MLDTFALLSSSLCILYVMFRAAQMDRLFPWFEREAAPDGDAKAASRRDDTVQRGVPRR